MKRARRGARVVYIPGNHDEMFRQFTGLSFGGVEIRRKAIHETADGRKLLVLHGDEFDAIMLAHRWLAFVGDAAYAMLMRVNVVVNAARRRLRSEEQPSELQSLMRYSYAVFCSKKIH